MGGAIKLSQQFSRFVDVLESRSTRTSIVRNEAPISNILDVMEVFDSLFGIEIRGGRVVLFFQLPYLW